MNTKVFYSLFICFALLSNDLFAQSAAAIKGSVLRIDNGEPVAFALLTLHATEDSAQTLAYVSSDANGGFSIAQPTDKACFIKAALIGYKPAYVSVPGIFQAPDSLIRIYMEPSSFNLKEIVISSVQTVRQSKDTLVYRADSFRDSTERNLEDLLGKLPGVQVSANGKISVWGQEIKKILIDGDDMSGKNYQLMSRNLNAEIADKIQIIQNFSENRLLKNLGSSREIAINIQTKADKKDKLSINGDIGIGTGGGVRHNHRLTGIGLFSKVKSVSIGSYNSIGNPAMPAIEEESGIDERDIITNAALLHFRQTRFITAQQQSLLSARENYYNRFNQAGMATTRLVASLRPDLKISYWGGLGREKFSAFTDKSMQMRSLDNLYNIRENKTNRNQLSAHNHLVRVNHDINEVSSFSVVSSYEYAPTTNGFSVVDHQKNEINNNANLSNTSFMNAGNYVRRINKNYAFVGDIFYAKRSQEYDIQTNSSMPRIFPSGNGDTINFVEQKINNTLSFKRINGKLMYSNTIDTWEINAGIHKREEEIEGGFKLDDHETSNVPVFFSQRSSYIDFKYTRQFNRSNLFFSNSFNYFSYKLSNRLQTETLQKGRQYIFMPNIGWMHKNKKTETLLTLSYRPNLPGLNDLYTAYIMTDYRYLETGSQSYAIGRNYSLMGSHKYQNIFSLNTFYINIFSNINTKGYFNSFIFNNDYYISGKQAFTGVNFYTSVSGGADRYIPGIPLTLKVQPSVSFNQYQNKANSEVGREIKSYTAALNISLKTGFMSALNTAIGLKPSHSIFKTSVEGLPAPTQKMNAVGGYTDLYCRFSSQWNAQITCEYFGVKTPDQPQSAYYLAHAFIAYKPRKYPADIRLKVNNIFNNVEYISNFTSDIVYTTERIRLLPRIFMLELSIH